MPEFIHLHNHSHYSLLDGACRIEDMILVAKEMKMNALALTDHGNLFGAIEFYKKAKKEGIKPIIGCEAYIATGSRFDKNVKQGDEHYHHLILLAKNDSGYKNLMKLVSLAYTEGFYYRPRMDKESLEKYHEGLIVTSSCLKGEVNSNIVKDNEKAAEKAAVWYRELFGDDFYLEIQDHTLPEELKAREGTIKLARKLGIPLVATNDIHYLKKEHAQAHDILLCLHGNKDFEDPKRMRYPQEVYFKTPAMMAELFIQTPEAIENTLAIAEKCDLTIELGKIQLPHFSIPPGETAASLDDYMEKLAWEGMERRYKTVTTKLKERLEYELNVIKQMGYTGYFLIVQDFINYARQNDIPVGVGRGSAAGSMVAYVLGITNIDPIRYDLYFERFLNPDRVSMPDIDIDFCYERRNEIIDYVKQKYGEESVAQIITFGSMMSKGVLRDVGRVLKMNLSKVDKLSKSIPVIQGKPMPLHEAANVVPEIKELKESPLEEDIKLLEYSIILEGLSRHASTHAAGVVIAPQAISHFSPLFRNAQTGDITTQYNMKSIESIGLLKMDFLGLRTLTVIHKTLKSLKQKGIDLNLDTLPFDDPETFKIFCNGETGAVFQFESSGMADYLKKLKPERIEDLIAMNALYRPGPMQMIDDFIDRKFGRKKAEYLHPKMEPILRETYGIIVYQEQVMKLASELAGFSLAKADIMRRAMGKKDKKIMEQQHQQFIEGCVKNAIDGKIGEEVFNLIDKFASYGFNKSHSAAYAVIAYQTAYLKAHYPAMFMCANLNSEFDNSDRLVILMNECRRMGIEVLPPDINESDVYFTVTDKGIRFGLAAIKNIGVQAVNSILQARSKIGTFTTLFNFILNVDQRLVNKKVIESLIQAGSMDSLEGHRAQLFSAIDLAQSWASKAQIRQQSKIEDLFGGINGTESNRTGPLSLNYPLLPETPRWTTHEKLTKEKELVGFYISGHPLSRFEDEILAFSKIRLDGIQSLKEGETVAVCGMINGMRTILDRKGKQMAFVTLEDLWGNIEIVIFSDPFERYRPLIKVDSMIMVRGRINQRGEEKPKLLCEEIYPLENVKESFTKSIGLRIASPQSNDQVLEPVLNILRTNSGLVPVYITYRQSEREEIFMKSKKFQIHPTHELIQQLRQILGKENVWLNG